MDQRAFVPEEVISAVEFPVPGETFVGEVGLAIRTGDTLSVPCPVEDIQEEAVQDGPIAPGTDDHLLVNSRLAGLER